MASLEANKSTWAAKLEEVEKLDSEAAKLIGSRVGALISGYDDQIMQVGVRQRLLEKRATRRKEFLEVSGTLRELALHSPEDGALVFPELPNELAPFDLGLVAKDLLVDPLDQIQSEDERIDR